MLRHKNWGALGGHDLPRLNALRVLSPKFKMLATAFEKCHQQEIFRVERIQSQFFHLSLVLTFASLSLSCPINDFEATSDENG